MMNHDIFFEKWLSLSSNEAQETAMKNYMLSLSPDELIRFILWKTDMNDFREAQKNGEFSETTRLEILKESDKRIALKYKQKSAINEL